MSEVPPNPLAPVAASESELDRRAPAAARAAAVRTVLAGVLLAGHLPFWLQDGFQALFGLLRSLGVTWGAALALGNGILMLGAILLTGLMAAAVAPAVRAAAARSPAEGRAAAAGACMSAAGLSAVAIAGAHLFDLHYLGGTGLWLLVLRMGAAALGVGLFGAHLFRLAGEDARLGPTPALYTFLSGAGVATVLGLFGLGLLGLSPVTWGAMAFLAGTSLGAGAGALGGRARRLAALEGGLLSEAAGVDRDLAAPD